MADDKLTWEEKCKLISSMDVRQADDYDEEFLRQLRLTDIPGLEEMDDRVRRAQVKFIAEYWQGWKQLCRDMAMAKDETAASAMHVMLLTGYELGRKLRRPLTSRPGNQSQEANSK